MRVLFPTVTFAVFFTVVLAVSWTLADRPAAWKWFIVVAGAVFYGWWDVRFVALLAVTILANHALGRRIVLSRGRGRRGWLAAGIAANLLSLGVFKYYGFFVTSLLDLLRPVGLEPPLPLLQIALPVGVSFFTFEAIAYLVELHRGATAPPPLLDLAVWMSFFPKLQSGPITRPSEFLPQLHRGPDPDRLPPADALLLVGRGLFKKVVVASFLADALADDVFATPAAHSALEVLVGIYAYTIQLYVDFSGYTDMARGLAGLLGFDLPINFDRPYAATSIQDFWNRWHLTLSRWLRDHLFRPLGKRNVRRGPAATYATLVGVMLLAGLWHGAAWTFVLWGGIHGLGLAFDRWRRLRRRRLGLPRPREDGWPGVARRLVTFHVVAFAWVFFRADSVPRALEVLGRLGSWGPAPAVTPLVVATIVATLAVQYVPRTWGPRFVAGFARAGIAGQAAVLAIALLVIDVLGPQGVAPFIYFRF